VSDEIVLFGYLTLFAAFFVFTFWRAWEVYNRRGFGMYLGMWACVVLGVVFAVHSTLPSSAPRRQVVGMILSIEDHKEGRSHSYTVHFKTESGLDFVFDGAATPPFFAQGRDKVAVTYLDEHRAGHYPRAIEFRALTGARAGYDTAVSADWLGPWLGVLFAALSGIATIIGCNKNKRASHQVDAMSL
jgi:hypothetical protein